MRVLRKAGWPKARALVGGWAAWKESGLPIEESPDDFDTATQTDSEKI